MRWNLSTWIMLMIASVSGHDSIKIQNNDLVNTKYGEVRGNEMGGDKKAYSFYDIPYGKIGNFFQPPLVPDSWEGIRHIKQHNKKCPQLQDANNVVGDLDCLTLSVFKPADVQSASVLFHIHDGNFISGSGNPAVYGPEHLLSKDIIVVLPNYRLGPFGFLCFQNDVVPGNAALKDLTLALKWTKENIEKFGGNASDITVSGDGSAGALAGYLALSSKSNKYISKVITDSGFVLSHWALDRNPLETASLFITNLIKEGGDNDAITESKPLNVHSENKDNIIKAAGTTIFKPCVEISTESSFITQTPWEILHDEKVEISIPFIIGSANYAGMHEAVKHRKESIKNLNEEFIKFLPDDLYFDNDENKNVLSKRINQLYFQEDQICLDDIGKIALAYTDAWYLSPGIRTARALLEVGTTVYFYEFAFIGKLNSEMISLSDEIPGAARGDIVRYLFAKEREKLIQDSKEEEMRNMLIDLWASFTKTGNPTQKDIVWNNLKKTTAMEEEWLSINSEIKLEKGLHTDRLQLWTEIYNESYVELNNNGESENAGGDDNTITEGNIVDTEHGPVQGFMMHKSYNIQSYLDIPYGAFRGPFEEPTQPDSWTNVLKNKMHSKRCPQMNELKIFVGEIDCLTLSIFVPNDVKNASVLFHIYDGQFVSGSGDPAVYGPEHLVSKGVILVLPNYRLGPLGFLCLKNDSAPGNAALKDLLYALNWTINNINAFGGNPFDVTVSGEGTSGALVGYLTLSPKSRQYISKAIIESGSVLAHWAIDRDPLNTTNTYLEKLRNLTDNSDTDILQKADVATLLTAGRNIKFKPCIEDETQSAFIFHTPWEILHSENISITFMIGGANHAGMHEALTYTEDYLAQLNKHFENFLPNDLKFKNDEEKTKIAEKIRTQYFSKNSINNSVITNLSLAYTDAWYLSPEIRTALALIEARATVYLYEFAFVGSLNRELISLGNKIHGAARGDVVGYVFTQDGEVPKQGSEEERTLNLMTDLWISFVQKGKPTSKSLECMEWKGLEPDQENEDQEWLYIGSQVQLLKGLHGDRLKLWTDIYTNHFIERNFSLKLHSSIPMLFIVVLGLKNNFC